MPEPLFCAACGRSMAYTNDAGDTINVVALSLSLQVDDRLLEQILGPYYSIYSKQSTFDICYPCFLKALRVPLPVSPQESQL